MWGEVRKSSVVEMVRNGDEDKKGGDVDFDDEEDDAFIPLSSRYHCSYDVCMYSCSPPLLYLFGPSLRTYVNKVLVPHVPSRSSL